MKILDLVQPGDLVFDVGAHEGTKTDGYLARGAKVVCIEPQPWRATQLKKRFAHLEGRVAVEECALGSEQGAAPMLICDKSDTVSTLEPKWQTGRFSNLIWGTEIEVRLETLDAMIAKHGRPAFAKIDVEGYERFVLAGLSTPVPCMSIEFAIEFIEDTVSAMDKMVALGVTDWNIGTFAKDELLIDWTGDREAIMRAARSVCGGDIYGRCAP